jgi:hypothetical protein
MQATMTFKAFLRLVILGVLISGCSKEIMETNGERALVEADEKAAASSIAAGARKPATSQYITYTIQQGNHFCDQSTLKSVRTSEMKFMVVFDASAVYTTTNPVNQYDINKLWGFSEGFDNQYNSARFGWNWYNNALHLHAYVYNRGTRINQEIAVVPIGTEISCSIKVSGSSYVFAVNGTSITMSRGLSTSSASGYQQYPYFGGDEVAPHKISIKIRSL